MAQKYSYNELKLEQINHASTFKFYGIPIELEQKRLASNIINGCIPIEIGCLCVQDSPENPCPCYHRPPIIVWVPEKTILSSSKSDKKNHDGRELMFFELENAGQLIFESLLTIAVPVLKSVLTRGKKECGSSQPGKMYSKISTGNKTADAIIGAFSVGWAIGEAIDEATGASDAISDWLLDTFGPWPF